jgi:hypothetical protein
MFGDNGAHDWIEPPKKPRKPRAKKPCSECAALRERHAAEVEQAFREGYDEGLDCGNRGCLESSHQQGAWLASEAKAALARREP